MRVQSSEAISGFLKVYRLGRSSCWLSEGEEARVEPGSRTRSAGRGACAGDGGGSGGAADRCAGRLRVRAGRGRGRQGPAGGGRPGKPRKLSLACFSLGPNARTQADNCILYYCNWLGDIAKRIAAGAAISTDMVRGYAAAFGPAGCDELIFIRATASPGQLELLAGAVL
jgi:hypothetical protein